MYKVWSFVKNLPNIVQHFSFYMFKHFFNEKLLLFAGNSGNEKKVIENEYPQSQNCITRKDACR